MIEGSLLPADALVGEREEEVHDVLLADLVHPVDAIDVRVEVGDVVLVEVAAAGVEVDDLHQRRLTAVVEVRAGELHVAQRRRLEGAVDRHAIHGARLGLAVAADVGRVGERQLGAVLQHQSARRERERVSERVGSSASEVLLRGPHSDVGDAFEGPRERLEARGGHIDAAAGMQLVVRLDVDDD